MGWWGSVGQDTVQMASLIYPADSWTPHCCSPGVRCSMVLIGTDVQHRRMRPHGCKNGLVIRASIRPYGEGASSSSGGAGCAIMMLFNVPSARCLSWRLASAPITARGMPRPSRLAACDSPCAAIGWIGAGRDCSARDCGHHPIHALPVPEDPFPFVVFLQSRVPDTLTPPLLPEPKAIIYRRARSQFPWQGMPLDAGAPYVHDG
jgi:hypothetical protein